MQDFRLHRNGVNSPFAKNGRSRRAVERMEVWQELLNEGFGVMDIVDASITHRSDATARFQYKERILSLIETKELKDPHGVYDKHMATA